MAGPTLILAPDDYSGRKLGKYEILCRLSLGGMSEIFLAFQRGLAGFRKFVVLKQILPDIKGEEEFVRMFLDEARITAAFAHPNIAQVFDLDIADGELFLAMEFVPGATLVEVARACRQNNEPIPIGFTLAAVRDTALALHYAHTFTDPMGRAVQVIHRDIAEKNIMVTYDGTTKLLDFGIAKAVGRASRTSVGMVKGTSGYMSPEQILGEPLDPRSDLFSLGVVLHECLTGMRLFHGKKPEDAMMQAIKADVAPPSRGNGQISPELDAVVLKALQRARDDRYATALEFARAIEKVAFPLIWHPEQSAQFIARLFADRRDQTRALMSQASSVELTGELKLSRLLNGDDGALVTEPVPPAQFIVPPPLPPSAPPPVPVAADAPAPPASPSLPRRAPVRAPVERGGERRPPPAESPPPVATPIEVPVTPPSQRRRRPPRDAEVTLPHGRAGQRRSITPPPPPVAERFSAHRGNAADAEEVDAAARTLLERNDPSDGTEEGDALDDFTIPGRALPSDLALDRTHPEVVLPGDDDGRTLTGVGSDVPRDERRRRADAGLVAGSLTVAALLAVVGGIGWMLGLHEDVAHMLGLSSEVPAAAAPPQPEPLMRVAATPQPAAAPVADAAAAESATSATDAGSAPAAAAQVTAPAAAPAEPAEPLVLETLSFEEGAAAPASAPAPAPVKTAAVAPVAKPRAQRAPAKTAVVPASAEGSTPAPAPARATAKEKSLDDAWGDEAPTPSAASAAPAAPAPAVQAAPGSLTLVTEPWSTVFLGQRELGITPMVRLQLSAGRHTLRLVGSDGKTVALPVEIKSGEETKVRVPLSVLKPL